MNTTQTKPSQGCAPRGASCVATPVCDLKDSGDTLVLELELPGASEEAIEITLENGVLRIDARVGEEPAPAEARELAPLRFSRSFRLGREIDASAIEARLENGLLRLTLPRLRPAQRKIDVRPAAS